MLRIDHRHHTLQALLALLAVFALVTGACSSDDDSATTTAAPSEETDAADEDLADDPAYRGPGPYEVGLTELSLPDREVAVFHPAAEGSTDGAEPVTYSQLDALPEDLAAAAPALLPEGTDPEVLTVDIDGVAADVAGATGGPFPLALFSHGFGSFRLDASTPRRCSRASPRGGSWWRRPSTSNATVPRS